MRFAEVLPYLEAGRVCHWHSWDYRLVHRGLEYREPDGEWQELKDPGRSLFIDDGWSVVEEPAPAKPDEMTAKDWEELYRAECNSRNICIASLADRNATIARLTRELEVARGAARAICPRFGCVLATAHPGTCRDAFGRDYGLRAP